MAEFFQILSTFPTAIFAVAVALATAFWSLSILGGIGADVLGGVDADLDLDVDVDVDADVDVDVEADVDAETAAGGGGLTALAQLLRLGRVPLTVTLTLFAFGGFISSFLLNWGAFLLTGGPLTLIGAFGVTLLSLVLAAVFTNVFSQPLEPVFRIHGARSNQSLVGEVCRVTTGRVDAKFGQAELTVDNDHLTLQVRCDTEGAELPRGSEALIVHFDPEREAFVVEPLAEPPTT